MQNANEKKRKKNWKLKMKQNVENQNDVKKNVEIRISLMKNIFKFLLKNLRFRIESQLNFIHFFILFRFIFKKFKSIFMIKMIVKIYHDLTSTHKFKNQFTKFKIERLIFFRLNWLKTISSRSFWLKNSTNWLLKIKSFLRKIMKQQKKTCIKTFWNFMQMK